ncbi:MAG TPA: regulatory protein RecX [Smithella sp.]|nr:regulatory protein RecX [Smithella sp.]
MKVLDLAAARQKAFRLLSMRPHSEKELEKKLREKGFPAVVIKETLEKLYDLKYLNDASFAGQWARNLVVNKLWGNRKIITNLREKGIAAELIDQAILQAREELPEEEAIEFLVKKKAAKKKLPAFDIKAKQRIFQSLTGRGFPAGLILNKLGKALEENSNGDDWE